eukprot:g14920.t1
MAGGVEVEPAERVCLVDLSISGSKHPTVFPVKAVLDSGAGISTISTAVARRLQETHRDSTIVEALGHQRELRLADGSRRSVEHKTLPLTVALHTGWGPTVLREQRFAVMPGDDDVVIVGSPMLKRFGIDVHEMANAVARKGHEARIAGVDSPRVSDARRVALSVEALHGADRDDVPDEAVERLVARGPDMVMSPAEEAQGREEALAAAVESAVSAVLSGQGRGRLESIIDPHWDAFRRALRGDPPARVEPMRTTLAVWASAAMALEKSDGKHRLVSDLRAVNKTVEKSPAPMPNQEAEMQRMGQAVFYAHGEIKHDPERLSGLANLRCPETAGELMQFMQAHPRDGCTVLMFPDASDEHWGSLVTQVPQAEIDAEVPIEDMSHEPLGFLSGTFRGSQVRWANASASAFSTSLGLVVRDDEGLYRVSVGGRDVLWIPDDAQDLQITSDLKEVFQHTFNQGEFEMEALLNIGESHDRSGHVVRVRWAGFEEEEDTWEPLKTLWEDAPQFVKQQLRKMKLGSDVHDILKRNYGITL